MRILHYSDQSSPRFLDLYRQCDILVTTGDLSSFAFAGYEDNPDKKPAFGVYGNHDDGMYLEKLGIENLHWKVHQYMGLVWGGFQGCLQYKNSPLMFSEEEAKRFADDFPPVDVLLLHAGPKGMLDDPSDPVHIGSRYIQDYVLKKKPRHVFLGHQYTNDYLELENTDLFRTFGARIITIDD